MTDTTTLAANAAHQIEQFTEQASAKAEALTRRGLARAHQVGVEVRETAQRSGDRTVACIKEQPVKSVLIAAAAGATVAVLIGALARSRNA